jgi:uncharacterized lipoprotein YmbA
MAGRMLQIYSIALLAALAGGCASAPSRFYTLNATSTAGDAAAFGGAISVGPVTVPSSVDRPEIVVQVSPNRVDVDEFNRWAAPLGDAIARTVAEDLSKILGTPHVAVFPLAHFDSTYRVSIDVQRFDSTPGQAAVLQAVWVVHRMSDGESFSGRTDARETPDGPSYDALAAAHSRALAKLADDIAGAIRAVGSSVRRH